MLGDIISQMILSFTLHKADLPGPLQLLATTSTAITER